MTRSMTGGRVFGRLIRECLHFPIRLSAVLLSLLVVAGAQLYLTWLVKVWVEHAGSGHDNQIFGTLIGRAALTIGIAVTGVFVSRYLLNGINQLLVERLRNGIHARLFAMSVATVTHRQNGEWLSRVLNDTGALSTLVRDVLRRVIGEGIVIAGALAMMFYLHWRFAVAAWVAVPVVVLLLTRLGDVIRRRWALSQDALAGLTATLAEQLHGFKTVKGFQGEHLEHQRFRRLNAMCRDAVLRSEAWAAFLVALIWLLTGAGLLVAVWYGSRQALDGPTTAGELLAFCLYAAQTVEPMRRLGEAQGMLQAALAAAARVYELIDMPGEESAAAGTPLTASVAGSVRFRNVHFGYSADRRVLDGFDLDIAAGENMALVAASGGGKSTVASVLMRFAEVQRGQILLGGRDLRAWPLPDVRRAICVVEQHPWIFSGPLLDNIRYGSPHAPRTTIEHAVALVGLDALVRALPSGLDAWLQEGGRDLSAGQQQRIALARAIVRDPAVLLLDEATSALDSEAEAQIFAALDAWLRRRTLVVMAHRLATVSRFERIIVMEGGRVIADGSLRQLVRSCGTFVQLFAEQLASLELPGLTATPSRGARRIAQGRNAALEA